MGRFLLLGSANVLLVLKLAGSLAGYMEILQYGHKRLQKKKRRPERAAVITP